MGKGGMDISGMMKQMTDMQKKLQEQMKQMNEEKDEKDYNSSAGDDGIEVSICIDGNFNIKSIVIGDELKSLIVSDSEIYFAVLTDLIISAFAKAKSQIDSDSGGVDIDNIIPADMKNLLGNLGGFLK